MEIDIKKLTEETVKFMDEQASYGNAHYDVPFSVGQVLLTLYWDECVREVQAKIVEKFNNKGGLVK